MAQSRDIGHCGPRHNLSPGRSSAIELQGAPGALDYNGAALSQLAAGRKRRRSDKAGTSLYNQLGLYAGTRCGLP